MTDAQSLLRTLLATDAGRPRVTWYGDAGERVELSAKTLENWVAKTANLLTEELDAEPGTTVGIDLPAHWRTVVWMLAAWSVGANVVVDPEDDVDVLVSDEVRPHPRLVAVALPALATRYPGELPAGAVDAATEVRLQPDAFVPADEPGPKDPALTSRGTVMTYKKLFATKGRGDRILTAAGPAGAVHNYLAPLLGGGSVVLYDRDALDADAVYRIRTQENAVSA